MGAFCRGLKALGEYFLSASPYWKTPTTWVCPRHIPSSLISREQETCWYSGCPSKRPPLDQMPRQSNADAPRPSNVPPVKPLKEEVQAPLPISRLPIPPDQKEKPKPKEKPRPLFPPAAFIKKPTMVKVGNLEARAPDPAKKPKAAKPAEPKVLPVPEVVVVPEPVVVPPPPPPPPPVSENDEKPSEADRRRSATFKVHCAHCGLTLWRRKKDAEERAEFFCCREHQSAAKSGNPQK